MGVGGQGGGSYCFKLVCDSGFRDFVILVFHHSDFISAQYLENELMQLDQILHMH